MDNDKCVGSQEVRGEPFSADTCCVETKLARFKPLANVVYGQACHNR
jgi:hypothetical protein